MLNRILLTLFIIFACSACLQEKSSPDYSGEVTPPPSPAPVTKQEDVLKKFDKISDSKVCTYYPTRYSQPDWDAYFTQYSDRAVDGLTRAPQIMDLRRGVETKSFSLVYNQVAWIGGHGFMWVDKVEEVESQKIENCLYPNVKRLQIKNGKNIYIIDEWRTKMFYQPRHVIFQELGHIKIWQDVFTGAKALDLPLYREVLSDAEQKLFLRRRYGTFTLRLIDFSGGIKPISNLKLMVTNRMSAFVGNLAVKYQDNDVHVHLGPIEAFKVWNESFDNYKYIIEFGAEAPVFAGDIEQVLTKRAGGNFDRNSTRIRLLYDERPVNSEQPFIGEYMNAGLSNQWIHFSGSRPARAETFE